MLVLAAAPPHTFYLPISLNSLDREGLRLLSPRDSQITSKTRCKCRWYHSRRCDWTQVGVRWGLRTILRFLSRRSVVVPSWGDRGHCCIWGYLYFGSIVGTWLYLDECNVIYAIVWRGDCKPTMYLFSLFITWVVWRLPHLRHCLQCGYASKSCSDTWEI